MRWILILLLAGCTATTGMAPEGTTDAGVADTTSTSVSHTSTSPTSTSTSAPRSTTTSTTTTGPAPPPEPDDAPHAPVWATADAAILRPGAPIGWCTFNFLFWHPNGTYYVGTAAHCTDGPGQRIPLAGHGEVGTVVYDSDLVAADEQVDFSLIQLDAGMNLRANATILGGDGPTGVVAAGEAALGDALYHYGYGLVWGDLGPTRGRTAYLLSYGDEYCAEGAIWWGDSGSPVIHAPTGKAIGIVSRAGWVECVPFAGAQNIGPSMEWILQRLHQAGWPVVLATA